MSTSTPHQPAGIAAAAKFTPSTYSTLGKPNIIVIVMDDLGYGQLNFDDAAHQTAILEQRFVQPRYRVNLHKAIDAAKKSTPVLQKLQNEGIKLSNAYVAHAVSGPSRAALLTARAPSRYGVYSNQDAEQGIAHSEVFLAELFRNHGYHTAAIGKWHLSKVTHQSVPPEQQTRDYHDNFVSYSAEEDQPQNRGFNQFFGYHASGVAYYNSPSLFRNRERTPAVGYITEQLTNEAIAVVHTQREQPFFLYLAYNAPHIPLEAPAPAQYQIFDTGNAEVDNYYATIYAADQNIGRLMTALKNTGQADNTLIFFLSDNGAVIDSPMPMNGEFRANKGQTYQGGVHVPMFAWWPAQLQAGQTETQMISAMDILPTALAAAEIPIPPALLGQLEGVNLLPLLTGKTQQAPHDALYWVQPSALHWSEQNSAFWQEYEHYLQTKQDDPPLNPHTEAKSDFAWTLRNADWALHYAQDNGQFELYSTRDAAEQHNVAAKNPDVVAQLSQQMQQWLTQSTPAQSSNSASKHDRLLRAKYHFEW